MSAEHQSLTSAKTAPAMPAPKSKGKPASKDKGKGRNNSFRPAVPSTPKGGGAAKGPVTPGPTAVIFKDIKDWASAYTHRVVESDVLTIAYCTSAGIPFRSVAKGFVNPHAIAHVCRDESLRLILQSEGRGKTTLSVLDWFGGGRNLSFAPKFGPYGWTEVNGVKIPSKEALSIVYTMGPDTAIAGDHGRTMTDCKIALGTTKFDVVFLQDIYHHGPTPESPFLPSSALEIIEGHAKAGKIYVINRTFFGIAGADDFGNGKEEQVFFRNSKGLVVSSPDPTSAAYACHPDTDWLAEYRTLDGVDLCPLHKVGPYNLVRLSPTLPQAQCLGEQSRPEPMFQLLDLYDSSWKKWFCDRVGGARLPLAIRHFCGIGGNEAPVHVPTWISLSSKFAVKSPNGQILDSLVSSVERSFARDAQCIALRTRFPSVYTQILQGTILACLHGERRTFGRDLDGLRRLNADTELVLANARSSSSPVSDVWSWKGYGLAALGVGAIVVVAFNPNARRLVKRVASATAVVQAVGSVFSGYFGGHLPSNLPGAFLCENVQQSAILEEGLAAVCSPLYFFGVAVELGSNVVQNPVGALATLGMHGISHSLRGLGVGGQLGALLFHVGWNTYAQRTRVTSLSEKFLDQYALGNVICDVESGWEPLPGGLILPSYTTRIMSPPADFRGTIQVFVDHVEVSVEEAFELLDDDRGNNGTYPILVTHRLLHQPANCAKNLLAAIVHRLHADPFLNNPFSEKVRHANWKKMATLIIKNGLLWEFPEKTVEMHEVFVLMGKKGDRIKRAYENIIAGRTLEYRKSINLKWNETLSVTKEMEGVLTMKPRAIQNLEPEVHAVMAPFARVLNFIMHACFDGRVHVFEGQPIRLIFASGSTGAQLNEIGNLLLDGIPTFVASGDDSVVSFGGLHPTFDFGEADQSAFDHTQDDGPNRHFQGMIQEFLGFPKEFTRTAYEACSSGYFSRKGRFFARGECGTQMPTGITTTTTYNSLATLAMWLFWLLNRDQEIGVVGAMLGFKVKFQGAVALNQVTFLKGWWLQTIEGPVVWYPLPSAVLKLGKVISDPLDITSFTRRGKRTKRSHQEAVAMCAFALANSYGSITEDYPIFGPFLGVLRRLGMSSPSALRKLEESLKPIATGGTLIPREAEIAIFLRYGITHEDVCRVERLLSKITSLPAYVEDPVFDLLANIDY